MRDGSSSLQPLRQFAQRGAEHGTQVRVFAHSIGHPRDHRCGLGAAIPQIHQGRQRVLLHPARRRRADTATRQSIGHRWHRADLVAQLGDQANREARTDASGAARLSFDTTIEPTAQPRRYSIEATVTGDYEALYDQAGLMLRLDERNWIKAGIASVVADNGANGGLVLGPAVTDFPYAITVEAC